VRSGVAAKRPEAEPSGDETAAMAQDGRRRAMGDDQLDLFGAEAAPRAPKSGRASAAPGTLFWAKLDAPGRLGWSDRSCSLASLAEARAQVVAIIAADVTPRLEEARAAGLSLRRIDPAVADLGPHRAALASDARLGRRAVVLADDPSDAALAVGRALRELGLDADAALDALGAALDPEREARLRGA
jgi:hypothetical protein